MSNHNPSRRRDTIALAVALLVTLLVAGCSAPADGAPAPECQTPAVVTDVVAPPADPTNLKIDETFNHWDIDAIQQGAAEWCRFDPSLCITTTVGPVAEGEANTVQQMSEGCPEIGRYVYATQQIKIFTACPYKRDNITVGIVAIHEVAHRWGAGHIVEPGHIMSQGGPRYMAHCVTEADLIEVCSHHTCTAPVYDGLCSTAEAMASNPALSPANP